MLGAVPSATYLSRWIHYPVNSTVNNYLADSGTGAHPGNLAAYPTAPTDFQMLEVCHLWRCPAGKNSKGRAKYLFKFVHAAGVAGVTPPTCDTPAAYQADRLQALSVGGFGPNNLVTPLPDGSPVTD